MKVMEAEYGGPAQWFHSWRLLARTARPEVSFLGIPPKTVAPQHTQEPNLYPMLYQDKVKRANAHAKLEGWKKKIQTVIFPSARQIIHRNDVISYFTEGLIDIK
jgi:hypothetical protein